MLTSEPRVEPDLYTMANGHMTTVNETNDISSLVIDPKFIPRKFQVYRKHVPVDQNGEYIPDYSIPIHISHTTNDGVCPTNDACLVQSDHVLTESASMQLCNANFTSHPGAPITIDVNGCVTTNGNMRVPPEGMEAQCMMAPQ